MTRRSFGVVSIVSLAGAVACTYDYDPFEPTESAAPDAGGLQDAADDATTGPSADAGDAQTADTDAGADADANDGAASCSDKLTCGTTAKTCNDGCAVTFTKCESGCGQGVPGQTCKDDCAAKRDTCKASCASTCLTCAGAACSAVCP